MIAELGQLSLQTAAHTRKFHFGLQPNPILQCFGVAAARRNLYRIHNTTQNSTRVASGFCVCFAQRQRGERGIWKPKRPRGDALKADKLVKLLSSVSDVKEEVYGVLDAWCAFEIDFPLVAVKKALHTLRGQWKWKRIIQVSKWMLSKGHGDTLATHSLLMQALDKEERVQEAEQLFKAMFRKHLDALPRSHFLLMMSIYRRAGKYHELLELFADMEELNVNPDIPTVELVAEVYDLIGMPEKSSKVLQKYPPRKWEYRYIKGKRTKVPARQLYGDEKVDRMLTMHRDMKHREQSDYKVLVEDYDSAF